MRLARAITRWGLALVVAHGLGVQPASASAIDFTSVNINFTNGNWSLGFEFDVLNPISVTALGFYDDLGNDLTESHDVGIFNSAGTLLVSATVNPGDTLDGFFRYTSIAPYLLAAGTGYRIAAVTGTENYTFNPNGFSVDPNIAFVSSAYTLSPTLVFPQFTDGSTAYFGPNFQLQAVPEPASLLLLGTGAGYLFARRRRRA